MNHVNVDPYAELAHDVEAAVITAGLTIADPNGPTTPNGLVASGVGVEGNDGERAVMLSWGCADEAAYETVDIMLAAVAEVLRAHGFAVEQHPHGGRAYLVTGRR